jgi:Mg2+ and Co2+ transporter CorA
MPAKIRLDLQGSKHHLAKLTEEIVADARVWYYDEPDPISMAELARHYGVSASTMEKALRGHTWKHVKQAKGAKNGTKHHSN